ncbi:MAG: hypothetical protein M3003_06825 [Candidatus Dormibacteraeota bacterium]|nr:hypothetical protein [Candidatus Dormibacteraeota bacterium]
MEASSAVVVEGRRLGKKAPKFDSRTLRFAKYVDPSMFSALPTTVDWRSKAQLPWDMLGNDQYGNCLAEGTVVNAPNARVGYRARYVGPGVTILTESGKRLTVTPNHAVLTPRGFVRAGSLQEGDYVISGGLAESVARSGNIDFDQAPAPIEQIVAALRRIAPRRGVSVPVPVDFHGDERFVDGDIDVVSANSLLQRELNASLREPDREQKIGSGRYLQGLFHRPRPSFQRTFSSRAPTLRTMRPVGQSSFFSNGHARVAETDPFIQAPGLMSGRADGMVHPAAINVELGGQRLAGFTSNVSLDRNGQVWKPPEGANPLAFASGPDLQASSLHPTRDGVVTDAEFPRNLIEAFPGLVQADRLVKVEHTQLIGHVYDLSTDQRWYVANGIVTHNCTCAALGHCEQVWTANSGSELIVTTEQVVEFATFCNALQGANMLDVLNKYLTRGIAGDKGLAFAAFDASPQLLRYAIATFGAAYIGVGLPVLAQSQDIWDFVDHSNGNEPNSWGGHAISVHAYEPGRYGLITWGQPKWMTELFFTKYCDEAYVILSQDWIDAQGKAPSGFDMAALKADLAKIKR